MSWNASAAAEPPFAATSEKYNMEYADGKVTGSNFPYHEVQSLSGYAERLTPSMAASDVAKELARYLAEYADSGDCPIPYQERDVAFYIWMQASRGMLEWITVLKVVRANRKRDRQSRITHYFGHRAVIDQKGVAKKRELIKLVRYIMQEGICTGCHVEFPYDQLTRDRTRPGAADGAYELSNVTLMCEHCNQLKADHHSG
ncbi:MAG: HNH endonuclease [Dehalococcoidia bacterium]|nr:HNH endonuclease [Dehalococcoidia bacterium]